MDNFFHIQDSKDSGSLMESLHGDHSEYLRTQDKYITVAVGLSLAPKIYRRYSTDRGKFRRIVEFIRTYFLRRTKEPFAIEMHSEYGPKDMRFHCHCVLTTTPEQVSLFTQQYRKQLESLCQISTGYSYEEMTDYMRNVGKHEGKKKYKTSIPPFYMSRLARKKPD